MASNSHPTSPGFFGIFFGVSLSVLAGALLAAAHLVAKPVEVLTVEPKEPEPGVVYFVRGVKGGDWERKVTALENSRGVVRFSEGELNSWTERVFEQNLLNEKTSDVPEARAAAKAMAKGLNLRLVGEELQVGLVLDRLVGAEGSTLVVQARGTFTKSVLGWGYRPQVGYVGALPLHKIPGALTLMAVFLSNAVPDLSGADSITVGEGVFAVRMP